MFGDAFAAVLRAARGGDETAWTRLYLDLAPTVTGYLRGRGCSVAEDVTSETMLNVVRDLRAFHGDESAFRSWVFTIAHHRLIDAARQSKVRPSSPTPNERLEDRASAGSSCEEQAIVGLGVSELEPLLCACTPDQRDVLLLRYVADLSLRQVAEVLGKEYNTVKAIQRRALNALREHLVETAYPELPVGALTTSR